ncbi:MAG TPA: hypothetical protein VMU96_05940 [Casimicrobiaceae bacterium]|nr:hypothetical protein [Casimicrobiaceae bacterium]
MAARKKSLTRSAFSAIVDPTMTNGVSSVSMMAMTRRSAAGAARPCSHRFRCRNSGDGTLGIALTRVPAVHTI